MRVITFIKIRNQYGELIANKNFHGVTTEAQRMETAITHGGSKVKQLPSVRYPKGLLRMNYQITITQ